MSIADTRSRVSLRADQASILHLIASICSENTETISVIDEFWSDERDLTVGARVGQIDMARSENRAGGGKGVSL